MSPGGFGSQAANVRLVENLRRIYTGFIEIVCHNGAYQRTLKLLGITDNDPYYLLPDKNLAVMSEHYFLSTQPRPLVELVLAASRETIQLNQKFPARLFAKRGLAMSTYFHLLNQGHNPNVDGSGNFLPMMAQIESSIVWKNGKSGKLLAGSAQLGIQHLPPTLNQAAHFIATHPQQTCVEPLIRALAKNSVRTLSVYGEPIKNNNLVGLYRILSALTNITTPSDPPNIILMHYAAPPNASELLSAMRNGSWPCIGECTALPHPTFTSADCESFSDFSALKRGETLLLFLGKLPQTVFEAIYANSRWPTVYEGPNTEVISQAAGRGFLHCAARQEPWNVNYTAMPTELRQLATSLEMLCAPEWSKKSVADLTTFFKLMRNQSSSTHQFFVEQATQYKKPENDRLLTGLNATLPARFFEQNASEPEPAFANREGNYSNDFYFSTQATIIYAIAETLATRALAKHKVDKKHVLIINGAVSVGLSLLMSISILPIMLMLSSSFLLQSEKTLPKNILQWVNSVSILLPILLSFASGNFSAIGKLLLSAGGCYAGNRFGIWCGNQIYDGVEQHFSYKK